MTDNEIIKAFRLCHRQNGVIPCFECPYYLEDTDECLGDNNADILDLINRQKAEIERLKEDCDKAWEEYSNLQIEYDKLFDEAVALIRKKKAEAVKKFAKKFKRKSVVWRIDNFDMGYQITDEEFDNLVKEMVGDTDE